MLRWCRSSFHVSRGYGGSKSYPIRQDASEPGFLRPSTPRPQPSRRAHSTQATAIARDPQDERTSTRSQQSHPSWPSFRFDTQLSQIPSLCIEWSPSTPGPSLCPPSLLQPTALNKHFHSPNSLPLQIYPINRRTSITSRKAEHDSRKIATIQSSQRQCGGTNPAVTLSRHLQPCHLQRLAVSEPVIDQMIGLYNSCRSKKLLRELSVTEFENLLTICGRYSSPRLQWSKLPRGVKVVSKPGKSGKVYWDFILQVVQDREMISGGRLTNVERFWRLNGLLYRLSSGIRSEERMVKITQQVNEDYIALRRLIANESFYLAYFRAMLVVDPTFRAVQVLDHLCDYLERFSQLSFSLLEILWRTLLTSRWDHAPSLQARLLNLVNARLSDPIPKTQYTPRSVNLELANSSQDIVTVHTLSKLFTSAIFPLDLTEQAPDLRLWAFQQTREVFDPSQQHDVRWSGLLLLAKNTTKSGNLHPVPNYQRSPPPTIRWQTILLLSSIEVMLKQLNPMELSSSEAKSYLQTVSNGLWKNWLQADYLQCPVDVKRAVISSFFKIAAAGTNESLLAECSRYCTDHNLWDWSAVGSSIIRRQTLGLVAAYVYSLGRCHHLQLPQVFDRIVQLVPDNTALSEVASLFLPLFLPHDVNRAHEFLCYTRAKGLEVSCEALVPLAIALSHDQQWEATVSLLKDDGLSDKQRETILMVILRIFQTSRYQTLDKRLAESLGQLLLQLYTAINPTPMSKYPVRYFLGLLIAAGSGPVAVNLANRLFLTAAPFFTQRCIRRWLVQLVQRGLPKQACKLFRLSRHHFTLPQSIDLERKLTTAFFAANALGGTGRVRLLKRSRLSQREKILRIALSRSGSKSPIPSLQVMTLMNRDPCPSPATIQTAVTILARQGRLLAARKLFFRHSTRLDPKVSTIIGNIILHGYIFFRGSKTPRAIRHIFHMKDVLSEGTNFAYDRTTMNILIKAILQSKKMASAPMFRALFDQLVRSGYPASERWRRENGVPFSTPAGAPLPPWAGQLPPVNQPLSFVNHVQPLYKMFVKAFYLEQDRAAAKWVIGILKEEKALDRARREVRSRSIREGVIRKKARERGKILE